LRVVPWIFARAYSIAGQNTFLTFHDVGQIVLILISLNVHQASEVHGIYQFDEAVQAISALKTPLRTGFLPVCLVHARTKLSDVYDVRPVNAEEESLPIGPYSYSSFPPLNQDQERVAVVNEMSPSDVPDMSHLVTVDVESIASTSRRDSRDTVGGSEPEPRQSNELLQADDIEGRGNEEGSDLSDRQDHEDLERDDDSVTVDCSAGAVSEFVSLESILAPIEHDDSNPSDSIGNYSRHGEVNRNADDPESLSASSVQEQDDDDDSSGEHVHDPAHQDENDSTGQHGYLVVFCARASFCNCSYFTVRKFST
jgi:hypothetical protein